MPSSPRAAKRPGNQRADVGIRPYEYARKRYSAKKSQLLLGNWDFCDYKPKITLAVWK